MLDPPCKSKSSEGVFFAGEEGKTQNYAGCRAGVVFREVQCDTTGDRCSLEMRAALPQVWVRYHIAAVEVPRGLQWVCRDDT